MAAYGAGLRVRPLCHAVPTHLLGSGTDIRVIQAMLGHQRIDTTARALRLEIERPARWPTKANFHCAPCLT